MMLGFFLFWALGPIGIAAAGMQLNDHEALLQLRDNFGNSSLLSSWSQTDCNAMQYVACTNDGFLSALTLSGSAIDPPLGGSIGDAIGSFPNLQSIVLSNLSLQGGLPSSLCNLTALTTLDLSHNNLNGSVPSCVANMASLSHLNLGSNLPLTGDIPACVGDMAGLRQLLLAQTGLTGGIPEELCRLTSLRELVIEAKLEGGIPPCLGNLHALTWMSFGFNNLKGPIPDELCNMTSIEAISLEHNQLSGGIPSCLSKAANLTKLAVGTNVLTGPIPRNFSSPYLLFYADENYLSGSPVLTFADAPATCVGQYFTNCFDDAGNCTPPTNPGAQQPPQQQQQRSPAECAAFCNATAAAGGPCGGHGRCFFSSSEAACACDAGFVAAGGTGAAATCVPGAALHSPARPHLAFSEAPLSPHLALQYCLLEVGIYAALVPAERAATRTRCSPTSPARLVVTLRRMRQHKYELNAHPRGAGSSAQLLAKLEEQSVRVIGLDDIQAATGDFSNEKLLGKGGFGSVYLGHRDGTPAWAVKRATNASKERLAVFEDEILVYEYVPCGTLRDRLLPSPGSAAAAAAPLSWAQRLDVAVGVARGLNYLHSFSQKPIVHRDIKSANILLDADAQPKIADFGLSKVLATRTTSTRGGSGGGGGGGAEGGDSGAAMVLSSIAGTFGYMDPELQRNLEVTPKLDVFSHAV
eukprot:jgi/Mesen1/7117/ME000369S06449